VTGSVDPIDRWIGSDHAAGAALELWRIAVANGGDDPCLHRTSGDLTWHDVDRRSDALAAALVDRGAEPGSRLALLLQDKPETGETLPPGERGGIVAEGPMVVPGLRWW
jgi:acyl-coenzyme A synthetase/AMP-(fatty) acid ligase